MLKSIDSAPIQFRTECYFFDFSPVSINNKATNAPSPTGIATASVGKKYNEAAGSLSIIGPIKIAANGLTTARINRRIAILRIAELSFLRTKKFK